MSSLELQNIDENVVRRYLSEYGVHDLRNIARTLGVKAPTQFAKDKLITEIASAVGRGEGCNCETRGRKPAKAALTEKYEEIIAKLKALSANRTAVPEEQVLPTVKPETDSLTQSVLAIKKFLKTDDHTEIIIAVATALQKIGQSDKS